MKVYMDKMLAPLKEKNGEYTAEMIRTLEAFLDHDGRVNEAARELFLHRNTVAYRLEKISELLQVDFKKANDLLRLKLVFMFRRFMEAEKGGRADKRLAN